MEKLEKENTVKLKLSKRINYNKWGIIFILPFFITYIIWSLIPLILTFYYSFFEYYRDNLTVIGPKFVGFKNYIDIFADQSLLKYAGNTLEMWSIGFIFQIIVSLVLAMIFTSTKLKIKGKRFFKTVVYMPNLIMASSFAMLFFTLFSPIGPVNHLLVQSKIIPESFDFLSQTWSTMGLIALTNFLMWFGNTTILLMAGVMGIDRSLFEAAEMDGANSFQIFRKVVMPLLMPIFIYVFITSLIGGIQMFDVPQILTNGAGNPNRSTMTLIMYLNKSLSSKNYGIGGAISVMLFIITGILSYIVYTILMKPYKTKDAYNAKKRGKKND